MPLNFSQVDPRQSTNSRQKARLLISVSSKISVPIGSYIPGTCGDTGPGPVRSGSRLIPKEIADV
jgi:hypothetical protein